MSRCKAKTRKGARCKRSAGDNGLCGQHREWQDNGARKPRKSTPKKPGRPEKFTADQVIEALVEARGMQSIAARQLKCDRGTVAEYAKRYPEVAATIAEQREEALDIAELTLMREVQKGEGWAICFFLKTQGRQRGYIEKLDVAIEQVRKSERAWFFETLDRLGLTDEQRAQLAEISGGEGRVH